MSQQTCYVLNQPEPAQGQEAVTSVPSTNSDLASYPSFPRNLSRTISTNSQRTDPHHPCYFFGDVGGP